MEEVSSLRIIFPDSIENMWNQIEPYIIWDGADWHFRKDTPSEIIELEKEYSAKVNEIIKKAERLNFT